MDLKKMNKDEHLKLKSEVSEQLKFIDNFKTEIKSSKQKNCLSDLKKNDKIFCVIFSKSKIWNIDYVKIEFYERKNDTYWMNYSTSHDTKPMGSSSCVAVECMNRHYFLSDSYSCMHFYTLKPESWKEDLKSEIDRLSKRKKKNFNEELKAFKTNVSSFIQNNDVDDLIKNLL